MPAVSYSDARVTLPAPVASTAPPPLYPPTVTPPPAPLGTFLFLRRFVENPLLTLPAAVYNEPMLVVRRPNRTGAWITSPELIEDVLIKRADELSKSQIERRVFRHSLGEGVLIAEGADWRWQRRAMAPLFRPADVMGYVPAFSRAADAMLATWRSAGGAGVRAVDADMTAITFDVITTTMLAGIEADEAVAMMSATHQLLDRSSWEVAYTVLGFPDWLWHPAKRQMRAGGRTLRSAVDQILNRYRSQRSAGAVAADDLLGRLIAARDPETGQGMTDERLIDNLLTLLEAGHETTAKALMWTLYLLARAPEWQTRVREEVTAVAGSGPIMSSHLPRLIQTTQVTKEAMRLYPPAPVLGRMTLAEMTIAGETLPAGSLVVVPIFALHRHRKLWEDPDRFDPTRFTPERERQIPRAQFMPFGAGARVCIGAQFAMAEAIVILATLVRGARFDWDGHHLPQPVSRVTLRAKGGMPLIVTPL